MFLLTLTLGTLLITLACISNIAGIINPALMSETSTLTNAQKVQEYSIFITLMYVLPMLMSLLTFHLYEKSKAYVMTMRKK